MMSDSEQPLHIGIACGGTGGHIFPGLATAYVLRERGHQITLWLAGKDVETDALRDWEGPRHTVQARGFESKRPLAVLRTLYSLWRAAGICRKLMRPNPPDVMLAMGSYASAGPSRAALRLGVPLVLHEANVYPGRMVRHFASRATAVAACFEETRHYLQAVDLVVTGMPLRADLHGPRNDKPPGSPFTILVMGGSRGATALNDHVSLAATRLHEMRSDFDLIHLTGRSDVNRVQEAYVKAGVPARVEPFVGDMAPLYREADLAVCRAGAATCAELSAFGLPALLVPYPHAAADHQTANARAMEKMGAADAIAESALETDWLVEYVDGMMNNPGRLHRLSQASRTRAGERGAESLASLVEETALEAREANT